MFPELGTHAISSEMRSKLERHCEEERRKYDALVATGDLDSIYPTVKRSRKDTIAEERLENVDADVENLDTDVESCGEPIAHSTTTPPVPLATIPHLESVDTCSNVASATALAVDSAPLLPPFNKNVLETSQVTTAFLEHVHQYNALEPQNCVQLQTQSINIEHLLPPTLTTEQSLSQLELPYIKLQRFDRQLHQEPASEQHHQTPYNDLTKSDVLQHHPSVPAMMQAPVVLANTGEHTISLVPVLSYQCSLCWLTFATHDICVQHLLSAHSMIHAFPTGQAYLSLQSSSMLDQENNSIVLQQQQQQQPLLHIAIGETSSAMQQFPSIIPNDISLETTVSGAVFSAENINVTESDNLLSFRNIELCDTMVIRSDNSEPTIDGVADTITPDIGSETNLSISSNQNPDNSITTTKAQLWCQNTTPDKDTEQALQSSSSDHTNFVNNLSEHPSSQTMPEASLISLNVPNSLTNTKMKHVFSPISSCASTSTDVKAVKPFDADDSHGKLINKLVSQTSTKSKILLKKKRKSNLTRKLKDGASGRLASRCKTRATNDASEQMRLSVKGGSASQLINSPPLNRLTDQEQEEQEENDDELGTRIKKDREILSVSCKLIIMLHTLNNTCIVL